MSSLPNRRSQRVMRAAAVALLVVGPSMLAAQVAADVPKTHTVKKGDTLWDLAAHYLGDAFRWPELYRLNTDVVEDPHWIYPGEILKLPGYTEVKAPGLAQPARDSVAVAPPTALPLDTARPPRTPTRFGRKENTQRTLITPAPVDTTPVQPVVAEVDTPRPAVRYWDYLRAPYVDRLKGPPVWGRILGSADIPGIEPARARGRFQLNDRVLIAPPTGSVGPEKELYLAYRNGPLLEEIGQVIVPTGVVEVIRPPVNGEAAIARIVRMFEAVDERDRLMPYDSSALSIVGAPTPIKFGREGEVRWVLDEPVLPGPTYFVVLSLTSVDGLKPGDEVELYQGRKKALDEGGFATPEITVGRAQVIRVTPFGATAMITRLEQPKVEKGTKVRVVAKMQ